MSSGFRGSVAQALVLGVPYRRQDRRRSWAFIGGDAGYSFRKTAMGSKRMARRAGTCAARRATATTAVMAANNATGSAGLTR